MSSFFNSILKKSTEVKKDKSSLTQPNESETQIWNDNDDDLFTGLTLNDAFGNTESTNTTSALMDLKDIELKKSSDSSESDEPNASSVFSFLDADEESVSNEHLDGCHSSIQDVNSSINVETSKFLYKETDENTQNVKDEMNNTTSLKYTKKVSAKKTKKNRSVHPGFANTKPCTSKKDISCQDQIEDAEFVEVIVIEADSMTNDNSLSDMTSDHTLNSPHNHKKLGNVESHGAGPNTFKHTSSCTSSVGLAEPPLFNETSISEFENESNTSEQILSDSENVIEANTKLSKSPDEKTFFNKFTLDLEECCLIQEKIKNNFQTFLDLQDDFIKQWKNDHLSEDELNLKINELKADQKQLELNEKYDLASEVEKEILSVCEKYRSSKFSHILLNIEKFLQDYEHHFSIDQRQNDDLIKKYNAILNSSAPCKSQDEITNKQFADKMLLLKDEKSNVERSISHIKLDLEHCVKNERILKMEVEDRTKGLCTEREVLIDKKCVVSDEIKQLKQKLEQLEKEEASYTGQINEIDIKMNAIHSEFQPSTEAMMKEKEKLHLQQLNLQNDMDKLIEEEDELKIKKELDIMERKKCDSTITNIGETLNVLKDKTASIVKINEIFNLDLLKTEPDESLTLKKSFLKSSKEQINQYNIMITDGENRLKSLKRSLENIETELSDLQKIKKIAVEDRNYREAKRISENIKILTSEGLEKQKLTVKISEDGKKFQNEMELLQDKYDNEELSVIKMEKQLDSEISVNLQQAITGIETFLQGNKDSWINNILKTELEHCKSILFKQEKDSSVSNTVKRSFEKSLHTLEQELKKAEAMEDWDLAETINEQIKGTKSI